MAKTTIGKIKISRTKISRKTNQVIGTKKYTNIPTFPKLLKIRSGFKKNKINTGKTACQAHGKFKSTKENNISKG